MNQAVNGAKSNGKETTFMRFAYRDGATERFRWVTQDRVYLGEIDLRALNPHAALAIAEDLVKACREHIDAMEKANRAAAETLRKDPPKPGILLPNRKHVS